MSTPLAAVEDLLARTVAEAGATSDPEKLRAAFDRVLKELGIEPGDPAWTDGRDVVGTAYERLLAGHARRRLGQFFTPMPIARAMARWLFAEGTTLLLDPGCGSGSLLAAAAHERHSRTRLLGLDVDPMAITMAETNASLREILDLELRCTNFLLDPLPERPDAVLCNPPYTRHQALSAEEKQAIHAGLTERLGVEFSQLASLHVLFLIRALEVADDNARLAFITPAHWLDMNYARQVKEFVLEQTQVDAIIQFPAPELVFEHAATTATVTLIRKGAGRRASTRLLHAKSTTQADIAAVLDDAAAGTRVRLKASDKWSRSPRRATLKGVQLDEVAHVRRGLATGHNAFFVLSDEERREHGLNRCSLRYCLTSPRVITLDEVDEAAMNALPDDAPRWLFAPTRARIGGPLERYLRRADTLGVHERHLVSQRVKAGRHWWSVEADFEAPILFSYLNRQRPRFVRNRVAGVPLNSWLVIRPADDVDPERLFRALSARGVRTRLERDARRYGNGLWKLEPSELKRLRLDCDAASLRSGDGS